jgi:hypothetical protein
VVGFTEVCIILAQKADKALDKRAIREDGYVHHSATFTRGISCEKLVDLHAF